MKWKKFIWMISLSVIFGCQQATNYKSESVAEVVSDKEVAQVYTSPKEIQDGERKFIRTADLRFKVKDVLSSTEEIENLVKKFSGFVTNTNMSSQINGSNITIMSKDSSLQTTYYVMSNEVTIRVPNSYMDTVLKMIAQNIDFLDYRTLRAEDVGLQILSNQLKQNRNNNGRNIPSSGKTKSSIVADEYDIQKKEAFDDAKIANLSLNDQVNYSTIKVYMYQNPQFRREMIANEKNLDAYRPGFFSRIFDSILKGWNIIEDVVVFITQFWAVILVAGILYYFVYPRIKKRWKREKNK